jgi:hypothetical protein
MYSYISEEFFEDFIMKFLFFNGSRSSTLAFLNRKSRISPLSLITICSLNPEVENFNPPLLIVVDNDMQFEPENPTH